MDAILFSARQDIVNVDDAIRHLADHNELYWEVPFQIAEEKFSFPMLGFIHITGGQVEYRVSIANIIPHNPAHYEDPALADRVKPAPWRSEWQQNVNEARSPRWKNTLIITEIDPFSFETTSLKKYDGTSVKIAPQGYVRILPPNPKDAAFLAPTPRVLVPEKHLEAVVLHNLESVEPGLTLIEKQLATPAGRLDLLCRDLTGSYVVVELKKSQGTDQVVGQILRYMGWLIENKGTDKVRGIVIVQRKDRRLSYAAKAAPNIQVREFAITFSPG